MQTISYYDELDCIRTIETQDSQASLKVIDQLRDAPIDLDTIILNGVLRDLWTLERVE